MGFLGNLFETVKLAAYLSKKGFRAIEQWPTDEEPANEFSDARSYLKAAQMITWVNVCNSLIGEDVGAAAGVVYDKKNKPVKDERLQNLFEHPNPFQTAFEFKEMMSWYLLLAGNAYIWKVRNSKYDDMNGQPSELWLLNPSLMSPKINKKTWRVEGYKLRVQLDEVILPVEDIVHLKLPNPLNSFVGMGKIQANEVLYNTEKAAQHYNWRFFDKGGQPAIALTSEGDVSKDQRDELHERFKRYQGYKRAHGMIILSGGMDIKNIGLSQKDMMFIEQRKFTREEILAIHKVPPSKAGIFEYANYANAKEQDAYYWDGAIDPLLRRIGEAWTRGIVWAWNKEWKYKFDSVIRKDIELDQKIVNQRIENGMYSPNDALEYVGEERVKNIPAMDEHYMKLNLIPISMAGTPEPPEKGFGTETKATRLQLSILRMARNARRKAGKAIRKEMEGFFGGQGSEIGKIFDEVFRKRAVKDDDMPTKEEIDEFIWRIKEEIFEKTADGKIKNSIKKGHTSVMVQAIEDLNEVMRTEVDPSTANPQVTAGIGRLGRKITRVNNTTRDDIEKQIRDGVDAGESISKLKKRIEYVYSKARGYRAEMIARTESSRAYDQGSILSYKDAGIKFVDVIGCECDHAPCNQTHIPIEEADGLDFHPNHSGCLVPEL